MINAWVLANFNKYQFIALFTVLVLAVPTVILFHIQHHGFPQSHEGLRLYTSPLVNVFLLSTLWLTSFRRMKGLNRFASFRAVILATAIVISVMLGGWFFNLHWREVLLLMQPFMYIAYFWVLNRVVKDLYQPKTA